MANLQTDIAAGIATTIQAASFDTIFFDGAKAVDHAEVGYRADDDPYKKFSHMLIRPLPPEPDPEATVHQASERTLFPFDIMADIFDRSKAHETINVFTQLMLTNFADDGVILSANITDNGTNLLDPQVTVEMGTPEIETAEVGPDGIVPLDNPRVTLPLIVGAWHKLPLA